MFDIRSYFMYSHRWNQPRDVGLSVDTQKKKKKEKKKDEDEEEEKMVKDHYWCTRPGVEWFLCEPTMADCKSGGPTRMYW